MINSPYYTAEHDDFRRQVRRFVQTDIEPNINAWEEACSFPRSLYQRVAELGLLGLNFPSEYGGIPTSDRFFGLILVDEFSRAGSGGLMASLFSHNIALPPILAFGTAAQKQRYLPPVLAGEKIAALAITEPSGGSDVANLKTTAQRDNEYYVINGSKTFITSGMRADQYTVAVRTGEPGMAGISVLVIDADTPGFSRTPLKKMGWWCSDTATLYFQNCKVPAANLLGRENQGFMAIMRNFNDERIMLAAQALGLARCCIDESIAYAKQRTTFGKPLIRHQVIRHKLVDMLTQTNAVQATLENLCWRLDHQELPVAEVCLLKNLATSNLEQVAGEAVQIFGGAGFLRGAKVERIFRETKVLSIGGGASEIMKDLAARQLGF